MIELRDDQLIISFPEVHRDAVMTIDFQRTLRIPDDGRNYPLPAGLSRFPLRHVDDYAATVPADWIEHGGVMLPMYQSEALWLNFTSPREYAFAVRVATGKIDALTGQVWHNHLQPAPQNNLVVPSQPWLDGYCVEKGVIRQFVAMPLGSGYTAEEQLTGKAQVGGIQIVAHPMKRERWDQLQESRRLREAWAQEQELRWLREQWESAKRHHELLTSHYLGGAVSLDNHQPPAGLTTEGLNELHASYGRMDEAWRRYVHALESALADEQTGVSYMLSAQMSTAAPFMGLSPGGRMRQAIYEDGYGFESWDREHSARCFVHTANSEVWREITGERPPTKPISRTEYRRHRLPWFDYYAETETAVVGSKTLSSLQSVVQLASEKGETVLPDNGSIQVEKVFELRKGLQPGQVREAEF